MHTTATAASPTSAPPLIGAYKLEMNRKLVSTGFQHQQNPGPPCKPSCQQGQGSLYTTTGMPPCHEKEKINGVSLSSQASNAVSSPARPQTSSNSSVPLPLRPVSSVPMLSPTQRGFSPAKRQNCKSSPPGGTGFERTQSTHQRRTSSPPSSTPPSSSSQKTPVKSENSNSPPPSSMTDSKFACLYDATIPPPITKETLSELDLNRIVNDPRLRHDLNFEHEILFRPNTYGTRGEEKKNSENLYFDALALELDLYIRQRQRSPSPSPSPTSPRPANGTTAPNGDKAESQHHRQKPYPIDAPRRIPTMLLTIRDIVKTLVPTEKHLTVDAQFDIELKMQELAHGVCDIASLIEWLGNLLQQSCSPMRDPTVQAMVQRTQQAIREQDARELMEAVKDLFGLLECMKLDVANHQIRYLRLYLLEETTVYEQWKMRERIAGGWDVEDERDWFEDPITQSRNNHKRFHDFQRGMVRIVISPSTTVIPKTLGNDAERLKILQQEFRLYEYGSACGHTFTHTLSQLGFSGEPPQWARMQCLQRVWAVVARLQGGEQGLEGEGQSPVRLEAHSDVVLEIVRMAYLVRGFEALPADRAVRDAAWYLQQAIDKTSTLYADIKGKLRDELLGHVRMEMGGIGRMTPLEILNRYDPSSSPGLEVAGGGSNDAGRGEVGLIEGIARRVAHVAVVHWRVWGPLLHSRAEDREEGVVAVTGEEEMGERMRPVPRSVADGGDEDEVEGSDEAVDGGSSNGEEGNGDGGGDGDEGAAVRSRPESPL